MQDINSIKKKLKENEEEHKKLQTQLKDAEKELARIETEYRNTALPLLGEILIQTIKIDWRKINLEALSNELLKINKSTIESNGTDVSSKQKISELKKYVRDSKTKK